jgi:hypothetical protein
MGGATDAAVGGVGGATLGTGDAVDVAGVARGANENAVCDGVGQLSDPLEGHDCNIAPPYLHHSHRIGQLCDQCLVLRAGTRVLSTCTYTTSMVHVVADSAHIKKEF